MPTAAKLVSALLFALVGYVAAKVIAVEAAASRFVPYIQPEQMFGSLPIVAAAVGAACGWFVVGPRVGKGLGASFGYGVRTSATMVVLMLLLFAIREMVLRAMDMRYHGPFEAVQAVLGLVTDYAHVLLSPLVLLVLVVGGGISGMLAEASGRRWH